MRLFLWEKAAGASPGPRGTVLFAHGSSMASQPTFDLQVSGRSDSSAMDCFARLGYDTWCVDMEGYGRSDKRRDINANIANGADDLEAATEYITRTRRVESFLMYGVSSGALRASSPSATRSACGAWRSMKALAEFMISDAVQKLLPGEGIYAGRSDVKPPPGNPPIAQIKLIPVDYEQVEKDAKAPASALATTRGRGCTRRPGRRDSSTCACPGRRDPPSPSRGERRGARRR